MSGCAYPACDRPGTVLYQLVIVAIDRSKRSIDYGICAMHDRSPLARSTARGHVKTQAVRKHASNEQSPPSAPPAEASPRPRSADTRSSPSKPSSKPSRKKTAPAK